MSNNPWMPQPGNWVPDPIQNALGMAGVGDQMRMPTGVGDGLKMYYGGLLDLLQKPREAAMLPFGGADAVEARMDAGRAQRQAEWNHPSGGTFLQPILRNGEVSSYRPRDPITYALDQSGIGELGFEVATDPLTYLGGLGALGRGGKALQTGINKGINTALLAPFLAPMKAASIPLPGFGLGKAFQRTETNPITDAVTKVDSKSIGDYLFGGPSRSGQLHNYATSVQDMVKHLMSRGHDLETDMVDFTTAAAGKMYPAYDASVGAAEAVIRNARANASTSIIDITSIDPALGNRFTASIKQHIDEINENIRSGTIGREDAYNKIMKLYRSAADVATQVKAGKITDPDDLLTAFDRRRSAMDYLAGGRTGILADVPEAGRQRADVAFQGMAKHGERLFSDRETAEAAIRELWELRDAASGGSLGPYVSISGVRSSADLTAEINNRLSSLGLSPITGTKENPFGAQLRNSLHGLISGPTQGKLDDMLKNWGAAGDPLTENPYKLVFDATIRDRAHSLGMDPNAPGIANKIGRGIDEITTAWKTIQLMSPSYLATNALSGMASSTLAGLDPGQIAKNFGQNFFKALRGENIDIAEIAAQNARLGRTTPTGASASTGFLSDASTLRDMSGRGVDVLSRIGAPRMAGVGALLGGAAGLQASGEDDDWSKTALGVGTGILTGGTMPWLSRKVYQPLAQGTEQVLRQSAVVAGRDKFFKEQLPELTNLIDNALAGITVPPGDRAKLQKMIESRGGQVSVEDLNAILETAGVLPDVRRAAGNRWNSILDQADTSGVELSNSINFDYKNLNNAEEFMRQVLPFSTWGTKAFPFFAARIAENPIIGSTIARFEEDAEKARTSQGLSPRFAGSVEVPQVQQLWETLTGRPGERAFFNPLRGFAPASDAMRTASFERQGPPTAYQSVTDVLDLLGLSEHPALALVARLSGQDKNSPSQGPFPIRQAGPLAAATGIDLNQPGRIAETAARKAMGQGEPVDPGTVAALRRIDELALRNLNIPITNENDPRLGPYLRAKVDRSGPLWEQALEETRREQRARSAVGFGAQILSPAALLNPEEARISQARAGLLVPPDMSRQISTASASSPNAQAPAVVQQHITRAVQQLAAQNRPDLGGAIPPDVQALLADPTWKNIDKVRDLIYGAQAITDPLVRGYAGSGSPEKARLQNAVALYEDAPSKLLSSPEFRGMSEQDKATLTGILRGFPSWPRHLQQQVSSQNRQIPRLQAAVKAEQERILRQNPEIQHYFDYRKSKGGEASLDDFITNVLPGLTR